jgi:hypothetical protein
MHTQVNAEAFPPHSTLHHCTVLSKTYPIEYVLPARRFELAAYTAIQGHDLVKRPLEDSMHRAQGEYAQEVAALSKEATGSEPFNVLLEESRRRCSIGLRSDIP